VRLKANTFTNVILEYLDSVDIVGSFMSEIDKIVGHLEEQSKINGRLEACKHFNYVSRIQLKTGYGDSEKVSQVRKIFNNKRKEEIPQLLTQALKFDFYQT